MLSAPPALTVGELWSRNATHWTRARWPSAAGCRSQRWAESERRAVCWVAVGDHLHTEMVRNCDADLGEERFGTTRRDASAQGADGRPVRDVKPRMASDRQGGHARAHSPSVSDHREPAQGPQREQGRCRVWLQIRDPPGTAAPTTTAKQAPWPSDQGRTTVQSSAARKRHRRRLRDVHHG